jgi:hypothetical protein
MRKTTAAPRAALLSRPVEPTGTGISWDPASTAGPDNAGRGGVEAVGADAIWGDGATVVDEDATDVRTRWNAGAVGGNEFAVEMVPGDPVERGAAVGVVTVGVAGASSALASGLANTTRSVVPVGSRAIDSRPL